VAAPLNGTSCEPRSRCSWEQFNLHDERPLADLIRELLETSILYVKQELGDAAQAAIYRPLKKAGRVVGLLSGAAGAILCAVLCLSVGAVWGLGELLGGRYWASLLICAGLLICLGLGLMAWSRREMSERDKQGNGPTEKS